MTMHILKYPSNKEHPTEVEMWCGKFDWKYARYTHAFMIEHWIRKPQGIDICKECWNALHERIGERND